MSTQPVNYSVPPVERAMRVLRFIADGNHCNNTSQAAKKLDINRTTLLRLLHTLQQERMIEFTRDAGGYVLGTGLIELAAGALYSRDIVQIAHPELNGLVTALGLSAHLAILEGCDILYLLRETPNLHLVSNVRIGSKLPAHATTIGRIILANTNALQLDVILDKSNFVTVTDKTANSPDALRKQLAEDLEIGVAWSVGNFEAGIGSSAAVLIDASGNVAGAINVTGPEYEFAESTGRRDEIFQSITAAAERISRQLGYFPSSKLAKSS
jgi:DNA-binding IclR family transcriptional regulator